MPNAVQSLEYDCGRQSGWPVRRHGSAAVHNANNAPWFCISLSDFRSDVLTTHNHIKIAALVTITG